MNRGRLLAIGGGAAAAIAASVWLAAGSSGSVAAFAPPREIEPWPANAAREQGLRNEALLRARVWRPSDAAAFDFSGGPSDPSDLLARSPVQCRFVAKTITGTTPSTMKRDGAGTNCRATMCRTDRRAPSSMQISEAGRQLLASGLRAMSDRQIESLFTGARFPAFEAGRWFGPTAGVDAVPFFRNSLEPPRVSPAAAGPPTRSARQALTSSPPRLRLPD